MFTRRGLDEGESMSLRVDASAPFVEFRIPPDPAYVRIARLTAGDMGGRVGFSLDELDDVRLAVDEMCAFLLDALGSVLVIRMQVRERTLLVEGWIPDGVQDAVPSKISRLLLAALVDSCEFAVRGESPCVYMHKAACEIP